MAVRARCLCIVCALEFPRPMPHQLREVAQVSMMCPDLCAGRALQNRLDEQFTLDRRWLAQESFNRPGLWAALAACPLPIQRHRKGGWLPLQVVASLSVVHQAEIMRLAFKFLVLLRQYLRDRHLNVQLRIMFAISHHALQWLSRLNCVESLVPTFLCPRCRFEAAWHVCSSSSALMPVEVSR